MAILKQNTECWESAQALKEYAGDLYLHNGERLVFNACFPRGLNGKRVLDLACGGGRSTTFLHQQGGDVIGTDISKSLIGAAHKIFPSIHFQVGDAAYLEFVDESFDIVVFSANGLDCLYPLEQRHRAIREVYRVLRHGGPFLLSHHNLGALLFGWYKNLRPRKLFYRLRHILNGNVLNRECYLRTEDVGGIEMYFAWPSHVIQDMARRGFELVAVYPNCPILGFLQRSLGTQWLTKLADPWPYYEFRKI